MDQDLSHWLHEHQTDIQHRWWEVARATGLISETLLERLAQEDTVGSGSFRLRLLASLAADGSPDPNWLETLARELKQSDFQVLLGALRQTLFELLTQQIESGEPAASPDFETSASSVEPLSRAVEAMAEHWRALDWRIDQVSLAIAGACDDCLTGIDAEREHWQTLYNLARELSASIDLNYVLQKAISRILKALDAGRGAVLLLDSETGLVTPRAAQGWPEMSLNLTDMPSDWQRGYGDPLILKANTSDESALSALVGDETETVIAAPLLAHGQFHGIMAVVTSDASGFDQRQLDLVEAAVNQMAANIGGSQVVQTLNDQARELGLMSSQREAILTSIADGVVVNDERGRVILANPAAEHILNTAVQDLVGRDLKSLFELFTAGAREDILRAMTAVLSDPTVEIAPEAAHTVLQIDGRVINAHLAPVVTGDGGFLGIVTIFRDVTKEAEADRAKSEFVSTVSHELRTPMTAIKGYTDLLHSGAVGEINENQKRFLGIIKSNTDRLTALINDLLDISRVETGRVRFEPEMVQMGDIIANVIDSLAASASKKGHSLTYRVEAGLPEIMGDPNRLTQVFTNLVGNAINYTPDDGKISVSIYQVQGAIRADVQDDGIGIHPDDLGKVFERFYRADHPMVRESSGTGLGLPIAKMFIEMHGGRVWAESEPGQGTIFTVLLPLPTEQQKEADLEQIWSQIAVKLDKHLVVVVDDDRDIAELVRLQLEQAGYRVIVAGRGVEVLELARRHHPDLIVLDILLPDMDGRAVLETLKAEPTTADIPVLILSVVTDDGTAFDLGAAGYLTKPINETELLQATRAAFARRGRILVVEDDVDTIEMMRLALRRVGYTVDVAAEGYEALSLARRWRPEVILLDLRLPGMDGYEALTHLKRSPVTQSIPIVVTSAHVADPKKEIKRLKAMGVLSFLPKPFTVNQLVTEIDQAIEAVRRAQR
jgi:PAS domain S-box-containing protein